MRTPRPDAPILGELDLHLLAEGTHRRAYERLGAHPCVREGLAGATFAVWAPGASRVSVVGDFNAWDRDRHPLQRTEGGYWTGFVPGAQRGQRYKFDLTSSSGRPLPLKADPFAFRLEGAPGNAAVLQGLPERAWTDQAWMARRGDRHRREAPLAIYEVHLGSWQRGADGAFLGYRDLAERLLPYVKDLGFTHVQLLPVMEHPFYGSWGYQPTGLFAPTARYGPPEDFAAFVDAAHGLELGVLLDWVPAHFPDDDHGLARFDGTALYEHEDPRQGRHQDWDTLIYNYGRPEVETFLAASALYWLDRFHVDGLRLDAVASMLYLDYSRQPGAWIPNRHGGRENLEAVAFLRRLNATLHAAFPDTLTIAEESTAWPLVSAPAHLGGLGFDAKWDMGWMNDTLRYFRRPMQTRRWHQDDLTFGLTYHRSEAFILPLSHDEVVHEKGSLLRKMPGTRWEQFANLRLLLAWMMARSGRKLLFMGTELAPDTEWDHQRGLDWSLQEAPPHRSIGTLVRDLNALYRGEPALHEGDGAPEGFTWIDCGDRANCVLAVLRRGHDPGRPLVVVLNFTAQPHEGYRIGVPFPGPWVEVLNTDAEPYGGQNVGNLGVPVSSPHPHHGQPCSLLLTLPPLGALFLRPAP